ncbi:MAG: fibrillarin-like rRNA/tRNA 2'-O-methyltransferase [Candidatus Diapherotrites archaeon]|nr:fibrillarin-like rRNA/tRNA 2'-O-methyltransferase [Candidatus Diapherotrites archaeon]
MNFPKVLIQNRKVYTENSVPGSKVYGEMLIKIKGIEFREWNPFRSKLAAALLNGMKNMPIKPKTNVLYLGAAEGTTASHVSDIVGKDSIVLCVDFAPRVMRKLIEVSEERVNMIPVMGDANKPEQYEEYTGGIKFDIVYEDVAQPNQVEILKKNCDKYLKKDGFALLALKARSVDSTRHPDKIYRQIKQELKEVGFEIIEQINIDRFEKAHMFYVLKFK